MTEIKKMCFDEKPYLLHFAAQEFEGFRKEEIFSLCDRHGLTHVKEDLSKHIDWSDAFIPVNFVSDSEALTLLSDSILLKDVYEVWCSVDSLDQLYEEIKQLPSTLVDPYLKNELSQSFKLNVIALHKKIAHSEQVRLVESVLGTHECITAPISLDDPQIELALVFIYTFDKTHGSVVNTTPRKIYYGRCLKGSNRNNIIQKFSLKARHFLGNTSMDVRLSFLMSNFARVKRGNVVYDPFVGTGSLLLAAAYHGARCMGSDIDYKLMHGLGRSPKASEVMRSSGENVLANFRQYGLENYYIDCFIGDAHIFNLMRHSIAWLDAIITDPPYGLREASRKVSRKTLDEPRPADIPHFPMKEGCTAHDTYCDLLRLASRLLRIDGYLVFWLPVVRRRFHPDLIPSHPAFERVSYCEQILNNRISRLLITMVKVQPHHDDMDKEVKWYPELLEGCNQYDEHDSTNHRPVKGKEGLRQQYFQSIKVYEKCEVDPSLASHPLSSDNSLS